VNHVQAFGLSRSGGAVEEVEVKEEEAWAAVQCKALASFLALAKFADYLYSCIL